MRASIVVTAIACILATAAGAHAAKLASPSIYGAITQRQAACTLGNTGTKPASVVVHIFDESGNIVLSASSCTSPLQPGFVCSVFANIASGVAYACTAEVAGSAKFIRASLTLRDADEVPVRTAELR